MEVKCRANTFEVYTIEEAKALKIKVKKNWRKAEKGDWIQTNDDKVLQVVNKVVSKRKERKKDITFIRTGYGPVPTYKANIYAKQYPDWWQDNGYRYDLTRDVKPTLKQSTFIQNLLHYGDLGEDGMWTADSIVSSYQQIYRDNNPNTSLQRGLAILRKKRVKEYMSELMKDKLVDVGLDDDYVALKYKEFIEDNKVPANVKLNALNKVSDLLGHNVKQTEQIEGSTVIMLSDGDKKMLAKARKVLSDKEIKQLMEGKFSGLNQDQDTSY